MGITAASPARYEKALRKLFPRGEYWDAMFADPQSDVSLFCKAKTEELTRFRNRAGALLEEGFAETAGYLQKPACISKREIRRIGIAYDVLVFDITFPLRSSAFPLIHSYPAGELLDSAKNIVETMLAGARFGSAQFGKDRPAFVSKEYAEYLFYRNEPVAAFEEEVRSKMPANQTTGFRYEIKRDGTTAESGCLFYHANIKDSFIGDMVCDFTDFSIYPGISGEGGLMTDGYLSYCYRNTGGPDAAGISFTGDLVYDFADFSIHPGIFKEGFYGGSLS
jgi:hypothetical protein